MAFKLRSGNKPAFKMIGASPLKAGKVLKTLKKAKNLLSFTPQGIVGTALAEGAFAAGEGMYKAWDKAENINMNDPKNKKYAEWYYGTKGKQNENKSMQIKPGDKIKAISTDF